jgi:hypothetical protein
MSSGVWAYETATALAASRALTRFELLIIPAKTMAANAVMTPAVFKNLVCVMATLLNLLHELAK